MGEALIKMKATDILLLGGVGLGAYFLLFTKQGQGMIESLGINLGGAGGGGLGEELETLRAGSTALGYDDPFKYLDEDNIDAWDPTSKKYENIQKRAEKAAKRRRNKKHDMYIDASYYGSWIRQ